MSKFNTYQQDALTTVHIPILHAPEMQYFRDHPAARLSTPNPAPFKLPRCVPRTAAADGKSNAIRLFLKHKKELDASTGKINGKAWFLKHNAKAHQLDFSNTMLKLPPQKWRNQLMGRYCSPSSLLEVGFGWMHSSVNRTPRTQEGKIEGLDAQDAGGDFWAKVA